MACCIDECVYSLLGFIFTLFFFHIVPGSTRVLEYTGFHHLRPNHYTHEQMGMHALNFIFYFSHPRVISRCKKIGI